MLFFRNYVWFYGEGGFPERLLSEAAALGLCITHSRKEGETLFAACPARHYKHLRPLARRACMRLRLLKKRGPYFRLFPYRKRAGLPVGMVLAAALLYLLAGRIWVLQVEASVPVDEQAILSAVAAQGVYPGCRIQDVNMQLLRLGALSELSDMVYVSVNPSGCVARVVVNPRAPAPSVQHFKEGVSNLIATRDGVILSTEVYSGQATVKCGEGVTAGSLLVSGAIETQKGSTFLRRASGRVMAQTTRTLQVTVPLVETVKRPASKAIYRPYFRFLKWDIPLFTSLPLKGEFSVSTDTALPQTRTVTLPLGLINKRYIPLQVTTVRHTVKQAERMAKERLLIQRGALSAQGVEVLSVQGETLRRTKDAVTLSVTLQCKEDIAMEVPLELAENSAEN